VSLVSQELSQQRAWSPGEARTIKCHNKHRSINPFDRSSVELGETAWSPEKPYRGAAPRRSTTLIAGARALDVREPQLDCAARALPAAYARSPSAGRAARRDFRTCPRSPKPAFPATRRRPGAASSRGRRAASHIVDKLNGAINKAIQSPTFRERFAAIGDEPAGRHAGRIRRTDPHGFGKWGEVVRRSGARLD